MIGKKTIYSVLENADSLVIKAEYKEAISLYLSIKSDILKKYGHGGKPCGEPNRCIGSLIFFRIAECYFYCEEYEESMKYITKAADVGVSVSYLRLGLMYEKGLGCNIDYEKAEYYLLKAFQANIKYSAESLGYHYHYCCPDFGKALKYYILAIKDGNKKCYFNIGLLFYEGMSGLPNSNENALKYFIQATEVYERSHAYIGYIYFENNDYSNAKKHLLIASPEEDVQSMGMLS